MRSVFSSCLAAVAAVVIGSAAPNAAAQVVLSTNLDAPTYQLGPVHNQDRWWGPAGYQDVSDLQAHSGTQSLRTKAGYALRSFDTTEFDIRTSVEWWVQAWLYMPSQHQDINAVLSFNGVLYTPAIQLYANGRLMLNGGAYNGTPKYVELGAQALDRWIHLEIVHTLAPGGQPSNLITLRATGPGFSESFETLYGINGMPTELAVATGSGFAPEHGVAYWDDLRAGYGTVPSAVPEPSNWALLMAGLVALGWQTRRLRTRGRAC